MLAINMATFAALGTILLGLGEQNPYLPVIAVVAAMAAVWLTDILGVFRVNRRVTNVAVMLAVLLSLWQLFQIRGSVQVIAIANLLAYVMLILLFQKKDFRTWWHIALLSLLQVAASATFFQGVWFAGLLLLYFFVGLSAIALLFLHHERTHYHQARHRPIVPREVHTLAEQLGINWRRLGKIAAATFVVGPVSLFLDYGESEDPQGAARRAPKDAGGGRWPLGGEEPEFTGSADHLGGRAGVGLEFYRLLAGMIPGTLVVAVALFVLIPRFGRVNFTLPHLGSFAWNPRPTDPLRAVGFSDRVQLGELGILVEDPEEVMKVRFTDPVSGKVCRVEGGVYLRGAVLTHYRQGNWEFRGSGFAADRDKPGLQPLAPPRRGLPPGYVSQHIAIQPLDRDELFCVWPYVAFERNDRLMADAISERLRRSRRQRNRQMEYRLGTYAIADRLQAPLTPSPLPIRREQLLDLAAGDLPTLVATADRWIAEAGLGEAGVIERARRLETQLKSSGRFAYSLEGQSRDAALDPIEDFVKNTPQGHCEYFATALALMLRSQGIPSRLVVGYLTDEYDGLGEYFRVRQLNAHTWVESYVPPGTIHAMAAPPVFGLASADWSGGGWLRLDATPAAAGQATAGSIAKNVESWVEWVKSAWVSYVVEMDSARQRAAVYDPLRAIASRIRHGLIDPFWWKHLGGRLLALPGAIGRMLAEAGWFSWQAAALLLGTFGFGYLVYRAARFAARLLAAWLPGRRAARGRGARVAFYRRLEALLARRGLRRRPGQTQREFAAEAAGRLPGGRGGDLARSAACVAEAFYQVRFGPGSLDNRQAQTVEQALKELETAP